MPYFFVFNKVARPGGEILRELRVYPLAYFHRPFFVLAAWIVDGQRIGILIRS